MKSKKVTSILDILMENVPSAPEDDMVVNEEDEEDDKSTMPSDNLYASRGPRLNRDKVDKFKRGFSKGQPA